MRDSLCMTIRNGSVVPVWGTTREMVFQAVTLSNLNPSQMIVTRSQESVSTVPTRWLLAVSQCGELVECFAAVSPVCAVAGTVRVNGVSAWLTSFKCVARPQGASEWHPGMVDQGCTYRIPAYRNWGQPLLRYRHRCRYSSTNAYRKNLFGRLI